MSLTFPPSPAVDDTYSLPDGSTWRWNGTYWEDNTLNPGGWFNAVTVATLAYGSSPTATIDGLPGAQTLHLGIPEGPPGEDGSHGPVNLVAMLELMGMDPGGILPAVGTVPEWTAGMTSIAFNVSWFPTGATGHAVLATDPTHGTIVGGTVTYVDHTPVNPVDWIDSTFTIPTSTVDSATGEIVTAGGPGSFSPDLVAEDLPTLSSAGVLAAAEAYTDTHLASHVAASDPHGDRAAAATAAAAIVAAYAEPIVVRTVRTLTSSDSLVTADLVKELELNKATAANVTLTAQAVGSKVLFRNIGAGTWTVVAGASQTLLGSTSIGSGVGGHFECYATDKWLIVSAAVGATPPPPPDVQSFTTSGTWTAPTAPAGYSAYTSIEVIVIGGGAGGGSGRRNPASSNAGGGGGGGGAGMSRGVYPIGTVGSTVAVTVGAGGLGGSAQTTNGTDGLPGNPGGASSFGTLVVAAGGSMTLDGMTTSGGLGGTAAAGGAGSAGGGGMFPGQAGGAGGTGSSGTTALPVTAVGTGGGGGGGPHNASNVEFPGAAGGYNGLGRAGGAAGGTSAGAGAIPAVESGNTEASPGAGGGGGGAYGATQGAGLAAGARGGKWGGGGGGGGASAQTIGTGNSGKGGDGGPGFVQVICR